MRNNEKKSIFSLGPYGLILQIFLVVQYLVGYLKISSDGSNNLIFLDQVKRHCVCLYNIQIQGQYSTSSLITIAKDTSLGTQFGSYV